MPENQFFVDSDKLSAQALERKHRLENDPSARTDFMQYMDGMERISSDVMEQVLGQMRGYTYEQYTDADVRRALLQETCGVEELKALLSPAAKPHLEEMAARAKYETSRHFGNTVYLFTPLYIANYCENYCVYCGFNCYNDIVRKKLDAAEIEHEMRVIADAEQIKRVIHNIVNNSIKYMDKARGKINLRVKDVGDFVQVELEDNGRGIAAKDLPNIFDRFYRTDASRNSSKGGSGIGLSIVKKIIEEHGGKIWAASRENTGTTMYFVLRKYQEVPVHE